MSDTSDILGMPRLVFIAFLGPIIALCSIILAVLLSPSFIWQSNALSDLGHYIRIDIGPNPVVRAAIFNSGLIITGFFMLYYLYAFFRNTSDLPTKIGMLPFSGSVVFLIAIGVFSENFRPIHGWVSVAFFFSFPFAMWFLGIAWLRFPSLRWFSVISFLLPFVSIYIWWGTFNGLMPWTGAAIPELLTAFTAIGWIWTINLLYWKERLSLIC